MAAEAGRFSGLRLMGRDLDSGYGKAAERTLYAVVSERSVSFETAGKDCPWNR